MAPNADDDLPDIERIDPPGESSITLTEDDAEEPDDVEEQPRQEPPRDLKTGKWAGKKRERFLGSKKAQAELERASQEKTALQQRLESMERSNQTQQAMFAALIQRLGTPQVQQQRQPTADDHALDAIEAKMDQELQLLAQDRNRPQTEYRKMERERMRIISRMEAGAQIRQQPRQETGEVDGVPAKYVHRNDIMTSEFPWLATDKAAMRAAARYRTYLIEGEQMPDTIETDRLACAHIAAQRGLRGSSRPSNRDRQATSGFPSGGRAPRANGAPRSVQLPSRLLQGTGLPKSVLARLALGGDDE